MNLIPAIRKIARTLNKWLLVVLKPLQIVGNFVFLGLAYFIGVGFSAVLYRIGPGRERKHAETAAKESGASLWQELPPAPRDRDAWLRPF
jgi:hypothetical protein